MENKWGLEAYLESIRGKADGLVSLHNQASASISARRSRRLGRAAFGFTALGIVTLGIGITSFLVKDEGRWTLTQDQGVLLVVVLSVIGALIFTLGVLEWQLRKGHDPDAERTGPIGKLGERASEMRERASDWRPPRKAR
jgi:hypothetical protein